MEAESGLRHLRAEECQGLPTTPEAERRVLHSSFPTAFRRSCSASEEAKTRRSGEEKQSLSERGAPYRNGMSSRDREWWQKDRQESDQTGHFCSAKEYGLCSLRISWLIDCKKACSLPCSSLYRVECILIWTWCCLALLVLPDGRFSQM